MKQDIIERVKEANDIVEVIGERQNLRRAGANYVGVCPFHADTTPSLTVSRAKQIYKCFACGAGGDVIKYVMETERVTFYEALRMLARRAHVELPEEREESADDRRLRLERERLYGEARRLHGELLEGRGESEFFRYLSERGITQEAADVFGLGYGRSGFFRGRVTYPFFDAGGNVIGFTGRLTGWSKGCQMPKYKNSDESAIFHKGNVIFGLPQAKGEIVRKGYAVWVEGQNDVITMWQRGVRNVVCGSGSAMTEGHVRMLSRFTRSVTLMFDGDKAGRDATLKAMGTLLKAGMGVKAVRLPDGEDPDTFAQKRDDVEEVVSRAAGWGAYLLAEYPFVEDDIDGNAERVERLVEYAVLVDSDVKRGEFVKGICSRFGIGADVLRGRVKPVPRTDRWQNGYYGMDEAKEVMKERGGEWHLTFDEEVFCEGVCESAVILWKGKAGKHAVQSFRSEVNTVYVDGGELRFAEGCAGTEVDVCYRLHCGGVSVIVEREDGAVLFVDWLIDEIGGFYAQLNSNDKAAALDMALHTIAHTPGSLQTIKGKEWRERFGLGKSEYNKLLGEVFAEIRDRGSMERRKDDFQDMRPFDLNLLPDYVVQDETLKKVYDLYGYYPLLKNDGTRCAYAFRNDKGEGHTMLSNCYVEPLIHLYSQNDLNNKRIVKINHISEQAVYYEWPSTAFVSLQTFMRQLILAGAYNFGGTAVQFDRLRNNLLSGFTKCELLTVYGWQKEGFWAFPNAIYHRKEEGGPNVIEYTNNIGVMTHRRINYYSPACSEISVGKDSAQGSQYQQDRYMMYKDIPEGERISFAEWAALMDEVYKINDNGKWAVLFDVMTCFRDFIFETRRCFTSLFFSGPTGSGKSQIAFSMRSLFMSPNAAAFNLTTGTLPAFGAMMQRYRNIIVIMEEYNDEIDERIFQGLKAAVLDGQGRQKMSNAETKEMDLSDVNSVPLLLGQYAPQRDDGALANRCILCNVPYSQGFTEHEVAVFERLKSYEKSGLSNVLIEILDNRETVIRNYLGIFNEEYRKLKERINVEATKADGLTRIINSVAMVVAMCRLIEEKTALKLPFTYADFFKLAVDKVLYQVNSISTTNKMATFFSTVNFMITQGIIEKNRYMRIDVPSGNIVRVKDKNGNKPHDLLLPEGTKVLYMRLGDLYSAYYRQVGKGALSKQSLLSYLDSNPAYLGTAGVKFKYIEESVFDKAGTDVFGNDKIAGQTGMKYVVSNTTAYLFKYDMLKELMDIDFENEEETPTASALNNEVEDMPF